MDALNKVVDRVVDWVVILLLASMVVIVFAQVFFRYVLLHSPPWTEEFSRFNFIWLTFMGAVALFRRKHHLIIDTVVTMLPEKVRRALAIPVELIVAAVLLVLVTKGYELAQSGRLTRASTMNVPLTVVYAAIPVSAGLMLFHQLAGAVRFLRRTGSQP